MNLLGGPPPNNGSRTTGYACDTCENGYIAVACGDRILLIEPFERELVGELRGHRQRVNCVRFSRAISTTHLLVSSSRDGSVRVWDTDLKREFRVFQRKIETTCCCFCLKYPHILFTISIDNVLCGWDLTQSETLAGRFLEEKLDGNNAKDVVTCMESLLSGALVFGFASGLVILVDPFGRSLSKTILCQHTSSVCCLDAWIPSIPQLYRTCTEQNFCSLCENGCLKWANSSSNLVLRTIELKHEITSFVSVDRKPFNIFSMKCLFLGTDKIVMGSNIGKPIVYSLNSSSSQLIGGMCLLPKQNDTDMDTFHQGAIVGVNILYKANILWLISVGTDGNLALWNVTEMCFQHWILRGWNSFAVTFGIPLFSEYPIVVAYSNGSFGMFDHDSVNIKQLPLLQMKCRLAMLSREEFCTDILYCPDMLVGQSYVALITNWGQLILAQVHLSAVAKENLLLTNKYRLEVVCSCYIEGKKHSKSKRSRYQLFWSSTHEYLDSQDDKEYSVPSMNQLLVYDVGSSLPLDAVSLWLLSVNEGNNKLVWRYRTSLSFLMSSGYCNMEKSLATAISCSEDGSRIAIVCSFQHLFVLESRSLQILFYYAVDALQIISFSRALGLFSKTERQSNFYLAMFCANHRIALLSVQKNDSTLENEAIDWYDTISSKTIVCVSIAQSSDSCIRLAMGMSDGSIEIWSPFDRNSPIQKLIGHKDRILKLEWHMSNQCLFLISVSQDRTMRLWDISRWH